MRTTSRPSPAASTRATPCSTSITPRTRGRHRRQFRHDRRRRHRRSPGHGRETPFTEEQFLDLLALARKGVDETGRSAEDGGDVSARPARHPRGMSDHGRHRQITGRLVIATHNPGKLREMRELLAPFGIEAVSAGELGLPEPEETGTTFARQRAHQGARGGHGIGLPAFADDSGLAVDALDGDPASIRRAGPDRTRISGTRWNASKTLLRERGATRRRAHGAFRLRAVCRLAGRPRRGIRGRVDGALVWPPRGDRASATIRCSCPTAMGAPSAR